MEAPKNREIRRIKSKDCVRCGLGIDTVRKEGGCGCYVYGTKVADRHLWTIDATLEKDFTSSPNDRGINH